MLESNLVYHSYLNIAGSFRTGDKFISAREFPIQRRYVDIIFASVNDNFFNNQDKLRSLVYFNSIQLNYLAFFLDGKQKNSHQIQTFFQKPFLEIDKHYLNSFVNKGLLTRIGEKTFKVNSWVDFLPTRIIAIEAKISNLRSVLSQAEFNSKYFTESYILVPSTMGKRIKKYDEYLTSNNLGVILSNSEFKLNIKKAPLPCKNTNSFVFRNLQLQLSKSYISKPKNWLIHTRQGF